MRVLSSAALSLCLGFGLMGCVALLGDFTTDGATTSTTDSGSGDGSSGGSDGSSSGADGSVDAPSDAPVDAPGDGQVPKDPVEPFVLGANHDSTCASVAFHPGKPDEKRATFCWGANGDAVHLGRNPTDATFNGFSRPRTPDGPQAYVLFDMISGNASGSWFLGRAAPGQSVAAQIPYCWGSNDQAECGQPKTVFTQIPTVHGPPSGAVRITQGGAAPYHGCMVDANKHLLCWGQNNFCEVRSGSSAATCNQTVADPFVRVVEDQGGTIGGGDPLVYEVERFAGGYDHSCVVYRKVGATVAAVECWGNNPENQTGLTGKTYVESPSEVQGTASQLGFGNIELSAGNQHTCAIIDKKDLVCWGKNDVGQAVPGSDVPASPKKNDLPLAMQGSLSGLSLGGNVSCFITTVSGQPPRAVCFGDKQGPLGRALNEENLDFGFVAGIKDVTSIAVGGSHVCAIARGIADPPNAPLSVFCWGSNASKQIDPNFPGGGSPQPRRVELPVPQ